MIRKLLQSLQRIETMYDLKSITEEQYAMMELMNERLAHCNFHIMGKTMRYGRRSPVAGRKKRLNFLCRICAESNRF